LSEAGVTIAQRGEEAVMSDRDDVSIRAVEDDDLDAFFDHQRDPEAVRMAAVVPRERDAFTAHWRNIRANPAGDVGTIVVNGEVAGNVLSWEQSGQRLVGYWVGRAHWGRGVATRALTLFLHQVSQRPLHAHVAVHNSGSIKVLEKCGFERVVAPGGSSTLVGPDGVEEFLYVLNR
jgi:RimJ/RimL family protein N-acetyltransferase